MTKKILAVAATALISASAFAGGFVTNTNQNVAFLRQPAQNATISVGSAYFNPAGVGFLDRKFHLSFNVQNATQTREITGDYAPFALGKDNNGSSKKLFKGDSFVPVIPSFDAAWRFDDRFFASFHFGIVGGGGKAEYDNGLGSLESQAAVFPAILNAIVGQNAVTYSVETHLVAKQYVFAGQLNLGYRVNDVLSVAAGLRGNVIYNHYKGHMSNISYTGVETVIAAVPQIGAIFQQGGNLLADRYLLCSQKDFAWTPILSVDVNLGKVNFAAKYEFNTKVRLTNDTEDNKDAGMPQFADGADNIAADIPALLSLGVKYDVLPYLHLNLGYHQYFDKQASFFNALTGKNDRQDQIKNNSYEVLAGVEWDLSKKFTVSAGGQLTRFGWGDGYEFITDQSFNINSYSIGAGVRYRLNDRISFDVAVFKTFYDRTTKVWADYSHAGANVYSKLIAAAGPALSGLPFDVESLKSKIPGGTDEFYRTNTVLGIGVNFAF